MLITLLLKKHSDPVNTHTRWLPTPNHAAKDGESKPHTAPPRVPSLYPGEASALASFPSCPPFLSSLNLSPLFVFPAASSLLLDPLFTFSLPFLLISRSPSVLFLFLLERVLSSIIPSAQRHDSRLSLEERTFHLLHTLTSLCLMNAFTPLVYKMEGVIHNQA